MSPERRGHVDGDRRDQTIADGIDSLDRLRNDMRRAGLFDCADLLDEAFVTCLKAYVDRWGRMPPRIDDEPKGQAE